MGKRLLNDEIILSDAFLDLSSNAFKLYVVLNFMSDDDGVCNCIKRAISLSNCSQENYYELIAKNFIIDFPSLSVCVIKHWWMHNTKRTDRYAKTNYPEVLKFIEIKGNKSYTLTTLGNQMATKCQPNVSLNSNSNSNSNSISNTLGQKEPQQIAITSEQVKSDARVGRKKINSSLFEKFWNAYPKKVGKEKCVRWFDTQKIIDDALVDMMINSIDKQKDTEQWRKEKGQFIPHPFTWLNQKRWQDELVVETQEVLEEQNKNEAQNKAIEALKEESYRQLLAKRNSFAVGSERWLFANIDYLLAIGEITQEEADKQIDEYYKNNKKEIESNPIDFSKVAKKI